MLLQDWGFYINADVSTCKPSSEARWKCSIQHTIMHDICMVYIDVTKLIVQLLIGQGLNYAGKASKAGRLEAVGSLIHSQQLGRLQCPNPPVF